MKTSKRSASRAGAVLLPAHAHQLPCVTVHTSCVYRHQWRVREAAVGTATRTPLLQEAGLGRPVRHGSDSRRKRSDCWGGGGVGNTVFWTSVSGRSGGGVAIGASHELLLHLLRKLKAGSRAIREEQ